MLGLSIGLVRRISIDVNATSLVESLDVLIIINLLNDQSTNAVGEGTSLHTTIAIEQAAVQTSLTKIKQYRIMIRDAENRWNEVELHSSKFSDDVTSALRRLAIAKNQSDAEITAVIDAFFDNYDHPE